MRWTTKKLFLAIVLMVGLAGLGTAIYTSVFVGIYPFYVVAYHGGSLWLPHDTKSEALSASMRLALGKTPETHPGSFEWKQIGQGFEVAELPALAYGKEVDRIYLARIDPKFYRFEARNAPLGDRLIDDWTKRLGAVLVVNGSYYAPSGKPDTPFLSDGVLLGPKDYDAKAGAFVSSASFTGIRDLAHLDWKSAFQDADNAMVSYPLLIADGKNHMIRTSRWLANRSFIGQDNDGRIIIGTTTDAFFSLDRFAQFLSDAPLNLRFALNLDGGPIACQEVSLNGYERKTYGRWEAQADGDKVSLLTWAYNNKWGLPIALAVIPK
jgi:hypothetical protein